HRAARAGRAWACHRARLARRRRLRPRRRRAGRPGAADLPARQGRPDHGRTRGRQGGARRSVGSATMSAVRSEAPSRRREPALRVMTVPLLDAVLAIEVQAYTFPWTRGNFVDSLAANYLARVLLADDGELIGYFVAMQGFEEMHLLNLTVAAHHQG